MSTKPHISLCDTISQYNIIKCQKFSSSIWIVRTSWTSLEKVLTCCFAFVRMFADYPDVKGAFGPMLGSLSAADGRYTQELRDHGQRVLGTVDYVISNRQQQCDVISHLHDLGNRHITFDAKQDFMDVSSGIVLILIKSVHLKLYIDFIIYFISILNIKMLQLY